VALSVADLDRQIAFYEKALGFVLHWKADGKAGLGAGRDDLLELAEAKGARRVPRTTGLYHFAVLLPDRHALARAVARLFSQEYTNYPTDHVMTKTTYLRDPEGQEIEIYAESPEDGIMGMENGKMFARHADGTASDGREPLDLDRLFGELSPGEELAGPISPQARIGHVHLYVRDLDEAMSFYTEVVGFDSMGDSPEARMGMVSAGGYHHHIGLNTWQGQGARPAPAGSQGLRWFTILLPTEAERERVVRAIGQGDVVVEHTEEGILVRDPSGNAMNLRVATS